MNHFDLSIMQLFNVLAFKSDILDRAINMLANMELFKGAVMMTFLWAAWFIQDEKQHERRDTLVVTVLSGLIALVCGRLLAAFLPFRLRPLFESGLPIRFPMVEANETLRSWSAFPSDHAMLWCAVAMGIFLVSRKLGIVAMLYAVIMICFPRIYLGLHHPTDILGGAVLGIGTTLILTRAPISNALAKPFSNWRMSSRSSFYAVAFLLSYCLATHFDDLRFAVHSLKTHVSTPAGVLAHPNEPQA